MGFTKEEFEKAALDKKSHQEMERRMFGPLAVPEDSRKDVREALDLITKDASRNIYNGKGLKTLFNYWDKYFPNQKQSINCHSCRQAVHKFWKGINEMWLEHEKGNKEASSNS